MNESISSQDAPVKITLFLDHYVVYKENNGPFGSGVHLYLGWIVQEVGRRFGGATKTASNLQNNNGSPVNPNPNSARGLHPAEEKLFTVEVPRDGAILVVLQMVAENDTSEEVKAAFKRGQPVNLGNSEPDLNFNVSAGNPTASKLSAVASAFSVVKNMFFRKGPDHDYGHWLLSFVNTGEQIDAQVQKRGAYCSGEAGTPLRIDGVRRGFASLRYDDGENNIYPEFDILVTR